RNRRPPPRLRHRGSRRGRAHRRGDTRAVPDRPGALPRPHRGEEAANLDGFDERRGGNPPRLAPVWGWAQRAPEGRRGARTSVGEDDLVAALALGAVERGVGGPEQRSALPP